MIGCELCVKLFLFCSFQRDIPIPAPPPSHQGGQNMPACLYLWMGRCLSLAHLAFITTCVCQPGSLQQNTRKGADCIRRVPVSDRQRCQAIKCHLLLTCLSLMKEVLREGSVVGTSSQSSFSKILPHLHLSPLPLCFCCFCIQHCFVQQTRITSVYITLLFLKQGLPLMGLGGVKDEFEEVFASTTALLELVLQRTCMATPVWLTVGPSTVFAWGRTGHVLIESLQDPWDSVGSGHTGAVLVKGPVHSLCARKGPMHSLCARKVLCIPYVHKFLVVYNFLLKRQQMQEV